MHRKILLLLALITVTGPALAQGIRVELDGRMLSFDQPPAMIDGRLMVPLRGIFEALAAEVLYDGPTRTIKATKGSTVVELTLGSQAAKVNGNNVYLDVPAGTLGGRTMVPLRFVSEALGAEVKWDGLTKTVRIAGSGGVVDSPAPPPTSGGERPAIQSVIHTATSTLAPGQSFDVVILGDPGCRARFEIVGAIRSVTVPEVRSGRYETRYTIPNGLQVEGGVLIGYLTKNGLETASEANRTVTIRGAAAPQPAADWEVSPAPNSTVSETRPTITVNPPGRGRPDNVRLYVDGIDFSNQVDRRRRITWTPTYDLNPGTHQVEVVVGDNNSPEPQTYTWSFTIGAPTTGTTNFFPTNGSTVTESRPQIGASFSTAVNNPRLIIDGGDFTGSSVVSGNQIFWNPPYDLSPGLHRVQVTGYDLNGRALNYNWTFTLSAQNNSITDVSFAPTTLQSGQTTTITVRGPGGAYGTYSLSNGRSGVLREIQTGVYQGTYTATGVDQGSVSLTAQLRLTNGQTISANAPSNLSFNTSSLTVDNLRDGMTVPVSFNVQGSGVPGSQVVVRVTYPKGDVFGTNLTFQAVGLVGANRRYDISVDASQVPSGRQMTVQVSDSAGSAPIVITLRR
ncbi:MAG: stalk domain-containing protein [Vulcanimicrobiota bacterium]